MMRLLEMSEEGDYLNPNDRNEVHALFRDGGEPEDSEEMAFGQKSGKSKKLGKRAREAKRRRMIADLREQARQVRGRGLFVDCGLRVPS